MSRGIIAAVLSTLALVATAAPAVADDPYDVPDNATITIKGDGSGHGIGMSQYGAYGAAREGLTVDQILDFYYPGTSIGSVKGRIRVWISGDDGRTLTVDDRKGLDVRLGNGRVMQLHLMRPQAERWRITPTAEGVKLAWFEGRWRVQGGYRGDAAFEADGKPITVRTPDGPVAYRGSIGSTGRGADRRTVNVLPMEQYVRGVVPAEMSAASWPQHALRAQAVAARTYAAFERTQWKGRSYDICDTAACQAYGGASAEYPTSTKATAATAKDVLTYDGQLAFAMYSASNGGFTVDGGRPYLPAKADPYEGDSRDYYGWTRTVTAKQMEAEYHYDNLVSIAIEERNGEGPRGGRVLQVRVTAESGFTDTIEGDDFRADWNLPSTLFTITDVS